MFVKENGHGLKLIGVKPVKTKNGGTMTFVRLHDPDIYENYELLLSDDTPIVDNHGNLLIQLGSFVDLRLKPNFYMGKVNFHAHLTPIPTGK